MLHEDAVATLEGWDAPDDVQAGLRTYYLGWLARNPDAMWRECRPEHLTSSALVVDATGTRALLTLHKTVGRWLQLGGHCEAGDTTLTDAALREATEESGLSSLSIDPEPLQLSRHEILAGGCAGTFHLDVQFLVTAGEDTGYVVGDESHDLAWYPLDGLPAGADHAVRELAAAATHRLSKAPS